MAHGDGRRGIAKLCHIATAGAVGDVLQAVLVPAATLKVAVSPAAVQLAAPKRRLQVWSERSAVLTAAVWPDLPVMVTLAAMAAKSTGGTVSTRPDESQAMVPPVAEASTSAQQLDCSGGRGGQETKGMCVAAPTENRPEELSHKPWLARERRPQDLQAMKYTPRTLEKGAAEAVPGIALAGGGGGAGGGGHACRAQQPQAGAQHPAPRGCPTSCCVRCLLNLQQHDLVGGGVAGRVPYRNSPPASKPVGQPTQSQRPLTIAFMGSYRFP